MWRGKTDKRTYYEFDGARKVRLQHHPNAAATYFLYDASGRLSEKGTKKDSDGSVLVRFACTRDAALSCGATKSNVGLTARGAEGA